MSPVKTKTQIIILLGPPGVGKGSQAHLMKNELALPHIATGDLLRSQIAAKTLLGLKAQAVIEAGHLVSDALVMEMIEERVTQEDCASGYILDGFPRTLAQAQAFDALVAEGSELRCINLFVDNETLIKRIIGRRLCKACQTPYHIDFAPPKKEGECDLCQTPLFQRKDDNLEAIEVRLKTYRSQTAPLIDYYRAKGALTTINCQGSKSEIFSQIVNHLQIN